MSITLVGIPAAFSTLILSAGPLVNATDFLLRRKHAAMDRYWNHMLMRCLDEKEHGLDTTRWLRSQQVALASGKLCLERALTLEQTGLVDTHADATPLSTLADERRSFSFKPLPHERIAYAAVACLGPLVFALSGASLEAILLECYLSLVLTFILMCDIRARIIPYQACIAYGIGSVGWVLLTQRFDTAIASMVLALASAIALALVERGALRLTSVSAIGAGDRRLIPLICFQIGVAGLLPGLVGLCVVAGAMAVKALLEGESKRSYLPFAPALVAFALVGTLWPLLPTPW